MKTLTPVQSAIIDSLSNQFAPLPKTSDSQLAMLAQFFKDEDLTEEIKTVASLIKAGVNILPTNRKALSGWLLGRLGIDASDGHNTDDMAAKSIERAILKMIDVDQRNGARGWIYVSVVKAQIKRRKGCCHDGEFRNEDFDSVISKLIASGEAETDAIGKQMRMTRAHRK